MIDLRKSLVACSLVLALLMAGCGKKRHKKNDKLAFGDTDSTQQTKLAESEIPVLEEELEDFFDEDEDESVSEFAFVDDDFEDDLIEDFDDNEKLAENEMEDIFLDEDEFEEEDSFVSWEDDEDIEEVNFKTVQFDINKNEITSEQKESLQEDIQAAREAISKGKNVIIQGHCCQLGSPSYNLPLSERRAKAIKAEMVNQGLPEDKIQTIGCGQEMPVVWSEKTDKNTLVKELAPNRRAEITIG